MLVDENVDFDNEHGSVQHELYERASAQPRYGVGESFQEFCARQKAGPYQVRRVRIGMEDDMRGNPQGFWVFANGARSDEFQHYDPPHDPQQLADLKILFHKERARQLTEKFDRLRERARSYATSGQAMPEWIEPELKKRKSLVEYHLKAAAKLADESPKAVAQREHEEQRRLQDAQRRFDLARVASIVIPTETE